MKSNTAVDDMFEIIEGLIEHSPSNPLLQQLMKAKPKLKDKEKGQSFEAYQAGRRQMYFVQQSIYNPKDADKLDAPPGDFDVWYSENYEE